MPGSFTTSKIDYEKCVSDKDDPVERYAVPNEEKIEWAFHVLSDVKDGYIYGTVEPKFGKRVVAKNAFLKMEHLLVLLRNKRVTEFSIHEFEI